MNGKMAKLDLKNEHEKIEYQYDNNYGVDIGMNSKCRKSEVEKELEKKKEYNIK